MLPQLFEVFENIVVQDLFARLKFVREFPDDFRNGFRSIATLHDFLRGRVQHQQAFGKKENGIAADRIRLEADMRRQAGTQG